MYLSKLMFDPHKRQVRNELANRYELHRTLCSQFKLTTMVDIGLLYRIEVGNPNVVEPIQMLVQTQVEPNWESLFERGLLLEPAAVKLFEPVFMKGDTYYFRLLANPTVRRKEGDYAGKRVALLREEEQAAWLTRKAKSGGFELLQLDFSEQGKIISRKFIEGKETSLTHQAMLYSGVLTVNESETFLDTYKKGIGSGKAFGFGLISIMRA